MASGLGPQIWRQIRWPYRLTLAGLWAERLTKAFWPLWSLVLAALALASFGLPGEFGLEIWWGALVGYCAALIWALVRGIRMLNRPRRADALARIDASLKGRPLQALTDAQAMGLEDEQSRLLWAAHLGRMARAAQEARRAPPDLRLSAADPYALRYIALTGAVMGLIFGTALRLTGPTAATPDGAAAAAGPSWEGWAVPPAYTGLPRLYLNDQAGGKLGLPLASKLSIRLYGAPGDLILSETVSARLDPGAASASEQEFDVQRSGLLAIEGPGGRTWQVDVIPDTPPTIALLDEVVRQADGGFSYAFKAADDYGVTGGEVTITLDLAAVDRRFGLAVAPEAAPPVTLDLPMPMRGGRKDVTEDLTDDLSQSVLSNLPVTMAFTVTDGAGQTGSAAPVSLTLPGRRFFDPLAAAVAEIRRDLIWSRSNAPRSVQVLRAITHRPEDLIRDHRAYLRLRVLIRELDAAITQGLTVPARDTIAAELWAIALMIEEGDLASALERLQRAQDRLDEAIRRGASSEEIQELMDEMRQALGNYLSELAEQQGEQSAEGAAPQMSMSADQLQQMFDKLQELMEQGRTAEAAELMEQLRRFMENMQVAQGEGGQGGTGPGNRAMRDLQDTLRDQQKLSDDAFRDLQDGQEDGTEGDLSGRQNDIARRLDDLNRNGALPGPGSEKGEEGRRQLDRSGDAMRRAEEALRLGDLPGAMDRQAEAMDALREGMRNFGEALAEGQRAADPGQSQRAEGQPDPNGLDPLGREPGNAARIGSDENMMQGEDVYRRADELLEDIRRRSGEQGRPEAERGYLGRLLDLFKG